VRCVDCAQSVEGADVGSWCVFVGRWPLSRRSLARITGMADWADFVDRCSLTVVGAALRERRVHRLIFQRDIGTLARGRVSTVNGRRKHATKRNLLGVRRGALSTVHRQRFRQTALPTVNGQRSTKSRPKRERAAYDAGPRPRSTVHRQRFRQTALPTVNGQRSTKSRHEARTRGVRRRASSTVNRQPNQRT
jgi:hypothetical protein